MHTNARGTLHTLLERREQRAVRAAQLSRLPPAEVAAATDAARAKIRVERNAWLSTEPQSVAVRLRNGEISIEEAIRRYGVICDWNDGSLLPKTTEQFRAAMRMRGAGR